MLTKRRKYTLFLVFTVLLVLFISHIFDNTPFETELIDIHIDEKHFRIPKNYLRSWSKNANASGYKSATIVMLLPDFEPRTKENIHLFDTKEKRRLRILVSNSKSVSPPVFDGNGNFVYGRQIFKPPFVKQGDLLFVGSDDSRDFFLTPDKKYFVRCMRLTSTLPFPSCNANFKTLGGGVTIALHFNSERSQSFPVIVKQVEEFLIKHEVKQEIEQ